MNVRIVLSGRNYDLADAIPNQISLPDGAGVKDALSAVADSLPEGKSLPDGCLVTVAGRHLGTVKSHQAQPLAEGDEVVLIAPVAGG